MNVIAKGDISWRTLFYSGLGIGLEGAVIGLVAKSQKPLQKPKKGILLNLDNENVQTAQVLITKISSGFTGSYQTSITAPSNCKEHTDK